MCMPRDFDNIPLETTYPYKLAQAFPELMVFNRAVRANTFVRQMNEMTIHDDLTSLKPDYVLVNIGMADCAPRLFTLRQNKVLNIMPGFVNKPIIKFYSKNRIFFTRRFPKVYVPQEVFAAKSRQLFEKARQTRAKLIIIGIAPVRKALLDRSHGFEQNIITYNDLLKKNLEKGDQFIDVFSILNPELDILPDGFHLTVTGNQAVFEEARKALQKIINGPI